MNQAREPILHSIELSTNYFKSIAGIYKIQQTRFVRIVFMLGNEDKEEGWRGWPTGFAVHLADEPGVKDLVNSESFAITPSMPGGCRHPA